MRVCIRNSQNNYLIRKYRETSVCAYVYSYSSNTFELTTATCIAYTQIYIHIGASTRETLIAASALIEFQEYSARGKCYFNKACNAFRSSMTGNRFDIFKGTCNDFIRRNNCDKIFSTGICYFFLLLEKKRWMQYARAVIYEFNENIRNCRGP